jgi:small subunit ribosomal protein S2
VLFVGTKRQAQETIADEARRVGMPYVNERWLGGMLTNFQTVSKRVTRLKELELIDFDDVAGSGRTKRELLGMRREKDKLAKVLGGIRDMPKVPSIVWIVDTNKEHLAIDEARKLGVPVVGILDSNCDPDDVQYGIPGNDDAIRAVGLLTRVIADAVAEGIRLRHASKTGDDAAEGAAEEPLTEWEQELLDGSSHDAAPAAEVAPAAEAAPVEEAAPAEEVAPVEEAAPAEEAAPVEAAKPAAKKAPAKKPAAPKPAAKKPAADEAADDAAVAETPAAKKAPATKPAAKKPAANAEEK